MLCPYGGGEAFDNQDLCLEGCGGSNASPVRGKDDDWGKDMTWATTRVWQRQDMGNHKGVPLRKQMPVRGEKRVKLVHRSLD